ncbi:MAG: hypothetical protein RIQ41_145, partial [Candidatus Parcubacteria bacterium]
KLQAIFVHVTYGNKTLREDKAVWKSRARKPRVRVFEGSVAGKVVRGEDLQSAAAREIGEELQLKVDPSRIVFNRQSLRTTNSYSFPGLVAVFDEAFLSLELRADEYKENGYVEETDDKITYFVWVST